MILLKGERYRSTHNYFICGQTSVYQLANINYKCLPIVSYDAANQNLLIGISSHNNYSENHSCQTHVRQVQQSGILDRCNGTSCMHETYNTMNKHKTRQN